MGLAGDRAAETGRLSPFSIPASAAVAGHRVLKNGDSFAVFDEFGHAQAAGAAAEGLFFEDTRYLSRLALTVGGQPPLLLSSAVTEGHTVLSVDLANPELGNSNGHPGLPASSVHVLNTIVLGANALFVTLDLANFAGSPARFEIVMRYAADFADIFEVRGTSRARRGDTLPVETTPSGVVLGYRGLDRLVRRTRIDFNGTPDAGEAGRAVWRIDLAHGERRSLCVEFHCERDRGGGPRLSRRSSLAESRRWAQERRAQIATIRTGNATFDEWLHCSRADLDMLATETPHGLYPYAGLPWFATAFGRDGLVTAFECLWLDPDLAAGTLSYLAANQATRFDPTADAEPGKILHERRLGEMAELGEVPFGRYYGSIDATPLFVMLAAAYHSRTGDLALPRRLWPNIEAALGWMQRRGERDRDGFIAYRREAADGLDNQGWKDSRDAICHADGRLAEAPIALVEVQAYAYAAYHGAAALAAALGLGERSGQLKVAAERLRHRFEEVFWLDDLGTYALALDGAGRPCRVNTSNAGHALFAGIASPERARRVAATLLSPTAFSGWGIRTLAEGEARYNPMSYHNGSVWPHDNALIAQGFARYGLTDRLLAVGDGLFGAAQYFELKRLPELFCGFARRPGLSPTAYPLACAPQAWSAATVFGLLGALLAVSFEPEACRIRFTRPVLPDWMREITLSNLRLDEGSVDLAIRRDGPHPEDVAISVIRRDGPVEVVITR